MSGTGASPLRRSIIAAVSRRSSSGKLRMSMTVVGLKAQINAWIHGTTAKKPTHPMALTASASGWLRAIAMRPGRPKMKMASARNATPMMNMARKVR